MSDVRVVELTIPGMLAFRNLALHVVVESCKLVGKERSGKVDTTNEEIAEGDKLDLSDAFLAEFISAFSEIYNNIPIHAYGQSHRHVPPPGPGDGGHTAAVAPHATLSATIDVKITIGEDHLTVELTDFGKSFDIQDVPLPEPLPTGGMGIHIARSMLDELSYEPGPPNRWRLTKYLPTTTPPLGPQPPASE